MRPMSVNLMIRCKYEGTFSDGDGKGTVIHACSEQSPPARLEAHHFESGCFVRPRPTAHATLALASEVGADQEASRLVIDDRSHSTQNDGEHAPGSDGSDINSD